MPKVATSSCPSTTTRTARAAIDWSYDLLTPPQRVLVRRLSIFAGPFDVATASIVAADTATATNGVDVAMVDDLLGDLVDRSVLLVDPDRSGRRFRLL